VTLPLGITSDSSTLHTGTFTVIILHNYFATQIDCWCLFHDSPPPSRTWSRGWHHHPYHSSSDFNTQVLGLLFSKLTGHAFKFQGKYRRV